MKNCSLLILFSLLLLSHQQGFSQCNDVKNGTFYTYPKNSGERWKIIREGSTEKDINLATGDTSVWDVDWQNDCQYKLKYVSGGKPKKEEAELFKKHVLVLTVEMNNPDYYLTNYYLDKKSKVAFLTDTVWKAERTVVNKALFTEVQPIEVRRMKFKDTSQYALLYVYRSGKFVGSLVNYLLKCDGIAMASMGNKSAYIFKILRPGTLHLVAQTINHDDRVDVDIQFGKKYYVRCDIKLTLDNGGRPVIDLVENSKGELGFLQAQ